MTFKKGDNKKEVVKRIRKPVDKRTNVIINPQRQMFLDNYTSVKSPTFGNAKQSAIRAGFSEEYAKTILYKPQKWLSAIDRQLGAERMLEKAEANLQSYQGLDITNGSDKIDPSILAVKVKNDQWLAERLDKTKYSTRTENATIVKVEYTIDEETRKRLDALL